MNLKIRKNEYLKAYYVNYFKLVSIYIDNQQTIAMASVSATHQYATTTTQYTLVDVGNHELDDTHEYTNDNEGVKVGGNFLCYEHDVEANVQDIDTSIQERSILQKLLSLFSF